MDEIIKFLSSGETYVGLFSLTIMLIVLDIDNVIFMSILTTDLPKELQTKAKRQGLLIGAILRSILFAGVGYLASLDDVHLTIPIVNHQLSIQDLITLGGGLFLMYKCTKEIHGKLEGEAEEGPKGPITLSSVLIQIAMINLIFSIDSVITSVGMVSNSYGHFKIPLMITGMLISMGLMFIFQMPISHFVQKHPTMKILALSFLLLIGALLVVEGVHFEGVEIPKGYIYFAMAFSLSVEILNINIRKRTHPVKLHGPIEQMEKIERKEEKLRKQHEKEAKA